MKQQRSGTGGRPSRFCKFLILAVGFKLALLGLSLAEPFVSLPSFFPSIHGLSALHGDKPKRETSVRASISLPMAVSQNNASSDAPLHKAQHAPSPPRASAGAAFAATPPPAQPQAPAAQAGQANSLTLEAMNRRQEELSRREQDLRALEKDLNARLEQMQALEMRLQTMLKDAEDTKNEKYKHLVDVLSNMKARQAAEVIGTLDEKIAVKVLAGMRGRQAGEVLTYADPGKAARLTEALARMQMPLE